MLKKILKKLFACFGCSTLIVIVFFIVFLNQVNRFWLQQPPKDAEEVAITIEPGVGLSGIAAQLSKEDLIASEFWFKVYAKLAGKSRSLQAGQFFLLSRTSYADLMDALIDAKTEEVQITIPEGYTVAQIGEVVTANFDISMDEWERMVGSESPLESHPFVANADKPDNVGLEGYLFPDTYRFFEEATAEEIVTRMLNEMEENVEAIRPEIGEHPGGPETVHEYLTLASILEREVRGSQDMAIVAGLFYNRLEIGMALQADSTVNYVTGKDTPGISLADTKLDSPYNTYVHAGLPPAPISNPGFNALKATAHPATTSYFFFLTDDEGTVYYAETFEEHVVNKNLYLR